MLFLSLWWQTVCVVASVGCEALVFNDWQLDGELCSFAEVALDGDVALMEHHNLLDVGETEAESLHVVYVASVYAVELIEHFLQVVAFNAEARVADGEV